MCLEEGYVRHINNYVTDPRKQALTVEHASPLKKLSKRENYRRLDGPITWVEPPCVTAWFTQSSPDTFQEANIIAVGIIETSIPAVERPESGKTYRLTVRIRKVIRGTLAGTELECSYTHVGAVRPLPLGHPVAMALSMTDGDCRLDGLWRLSVLDRLAK